MMINVSRFQTQKKISKYLKGTLGDLGFESDGRDAQLFPMDAQLPAEQNDALKHIFRNPTQGTPCQVSSLKIYRYSLLVVGSGFEDHLEKHKLWYVLKNEPSQPGMEFSSRYVLTFPLPTVVSTFIDPLLTPRNES
jgi:hypothetical protein